MKFITSLLVLASFSVFASSDYDKNCAKRFIYATVNLVDIAEQFNNGKIGAAAYAARVNYIESTRLAMGAFCINENIDAIECVDKTKPIFKKVRRKMQVRQVLKKKITKVKVSQLDLVPLRVITGSRGVRSAFQAKENICTME